MRALATAGIMTSIAVSAFSNGDAPGTESRLFPDLQIYVIQRIGEFEQIPQERKESLKKIAHYVKSRVSAQQPARLTFICTHNSRRSHLSQIWAATAARYYGTGKIQVYSGGTEATAFNPRAAAAIERAGFRVEKSDDGANPRYMIRDWESGETLTCFSKVYSDAPNPTEDFCAVMTCTQADKSCPVVQGCSLRVSLPFDDPKLADGTAEETATYDARCAEISREMLYLFSQVKR